MNRPVYLLPFIFIYNMVILLFKFLFKFIKSFNIGLFFVIYIFASVVVNFAILEFKGILFCLFLIFKYFYKIMRYISLGVFFCFYIFFDFVWYTYLYASYLVYKIFYFVLYYPFQGYVVISHFVYGFIRYVAFGFAFPFVFITRAIINARLKSKKFKKLEAEKRALQEKNKIIQDENKRRLEEKRVQESLQRLEKRQQAEEKQHAMELLKNQRRINGGLKNFFKKLKSSKKDITKQALLLDYESKDAEKSEKKKLYKYIAKNPSGKIIKGYFPAYSKVEVHSFLLSEGNEVYYIENNKLLDLMYGDGKNYNRKKIKTKDLIFFTTQLSTYIKAGLPLVDSLKILSRQFKKGTYSRIFRSLVYDLSMGDSFSMAMDKQGDAFPRLFINMVKTSEMTGELPEVLDDMADYFTEIDKTRKQMITAMTYPSIIFVLAMAAIVFIMVYVVPKFVGIYNNIDGATLPGITVFVINLSNFLQNSWLILVGSILVFVVGFIYLYRNIKSFKASVQWAIMHMPVFGNVVIYNEVTMFTKTLSSLLAHNVFITDSMDILNKITNNEVYRDLIADTIDNLSRGEKISLAFENHWAFPMPAYEMIKTGEMTGQLPEMMIKVSAYYQELHKNAVTRIKTFVEPALILFLTVVVGGIVLSIVIPMFSIYGAMGV